MPDTQVRDIFDRIAGRYDLLNRIISFRLDSLWRRKVIRALDLAGKPALVLDMGTGTGALALDACRVLAPGGRVVGVDFSRPMLQRAGAQARHARHGGRAAYVLAHALASPLRGESFDAVMSAFVLRNVGDLGRFFRESYRVLKPGGKVASLDMFPPPEGLFSRVYLALLRKAHAAHRQRRERRPRGLPLPFRLRPRVRAARARRRRARVRGLRRNPDRPLPVRRGLPTRRHQAGPRSRRDLTKGAAQP